MRYFRAAFVLFSVTVLASLSTVCPATATPGDEDWDEGFFLRGINQSANSVTTDGAGTVYVGGSFDTADNVIASHVAMWNGTSWRALRDGLSSVPRVLLVTSSGDLIAGGDFTDAGGDPDADRIAVWNGSSWSALGSHGGGLNGTVFAIAFDLSGNLIAGGNFTDAGGDPDADRVAIWDGSQWSSLGGAGSGVNSTVRAVAVSSGGTVVIGGYFTDAGGSATADYIAGWTGSAWSGIGGGLNGAVYDLAFASDGNLYVGGSFVDAGGNLDADHVAIWRSPSWRSVGGAGSGLNDRVSAITFGHSGELIVTGEFSDAGGDADADCIARWTGSSWTSIGGSRSALQYSPNDVAYDSSVGVVVVGSFKDAGGVPDADYLAHWTGSRWAPLTRTNLADGFGVDEPVRALAVDSQQRVWVGGEFEDAGGIQVADHLAMLDSTGWHAVGGSTAAFDDNVLAIAFLDDDHVVVGGEFVDAGGDPEADFVAVWDGVDWNALAGPGGGLENAVFSLAVGDDGRLYAGGDFSDAGGDPDADYLAVWDGVDWSAVVGPGGGVDGVVWAFAFDAMGNLIAGGDFSDTGGDPDADYVAVWDGSAWSSLGGPGSGLGGTVRALAFDSQGRLYAGGEGPGDPNNENVLMWDGASWTAVGDGLESSVFDLVFDGADNLYGVGEFYPPSGLPGEPNHIAVWDGVAWSGLGSGLNDTGFALAWDGGHNLYVGGSFDIAGVEASARIGLFEGATPATQVFADGFESGDTSAWSQSAP